MHLNWHPDQEGILIKMPSSQLLVSNSFITSLLKKS